MKHIKTCIKHIKTYNTYKNIYKTYKNLYKTYRILHKTYKNLYKTYMFCYVLLFVECFMFFIGRMCAWGPAPPLGRLPGGLDDPNYYSQNMPQDPGSISKTSTKRQQNIAKHTKTQQNIQLYICYYMFFICFYMF